MKNMQGFEVDRGLVSIIIPVYNAESFLDDLFLSLISQTYERWEAIAVDDGSTDTSPALLADFNKKDSRFKVISQENCGVSAARNAGLREAKGEFITFLDADDGLHPRFLEYGVAMLDKNGGDIFCAAAEKAATPHFLSIDALVSKKIEKPILYFLNNKHPKLLVTVWGKIYRRNLLDGLWFDEKMKNAAEDYLFSLICFLNAKSLLYSKQKLYFYRENPESLMHKPFGASYIEDHILLFLRSIEYFRCRASSKVLKLLTKRMHKTLFKVIVIMPFKNGKGCLALWDTYQKRLLSLSEAGYWRCPFLSLWQRFLCGLFLERRFGLLSCLLRAYQKIRR